MALYYFHVIDGSFLVDEIGTDCADMQEVRYEAIRTSAEILGGAAKEVSASLVWQMHVTDQTKKTVLKLSFQVDEPTLTIT